MLSLNEEELRKLKYDKTKIIISFLPIINNGIMTFRMSDNVNRNYTFNDIGNGCVVPCVKLKTEVAKSVFADVFSYEQTRIPSNYGTYNIIPKIMRKDCLNQFMYVHVRYPVFEGYFDNLYSANKSYTEIVIPMMLYKILPFERINDQKLIDEIQNKDFTDYSFDDFDDDNEDDENDNNNI